MAGDVYGVAGLQRESESPISHCFSPNQVNPPISIALDTAGAIGTLLGKSNDEQHAEELLK